MLKLVLLAASCRSVATAFEPCRTVEVSDLSTLGLPLRFVRELLNLAKSKGDPQRPTQPATPAHPPSHPPPHANESSAKARGKGKEGKESKGKPSQSLLPKPPAVPHVPSSPSSPSSAKGQGKAKDAKVVPPRLHQHKVFLNSWKFDQKFGLNGRIIGQQGRNVKWIQAETGVSIGLAGRGSGLPESAQSEGLHVLLQSESRQSLDQAKRLTDELVETVNEQYAAWKAGSGASAWQEDKNKKRSQPY